MDEFTGFSTEKITPGDFRENLELKPTQYDHWFAYSKLIQMLTRQKFSWVVNASKNRVTVFQVRIDF